MFTSERETEAAQARARLIRRLDKYGGTSARRLARILSRCTGNTACHSGACPSCGLARQQTVVGLCEEMIEEPARSQRGRMTALTIVPSSGCVAPEDLTAAFGQQVMAEVAAAVQSLNLPATILGFDISFNEDLVGELAPHWSVHAHGLLLGWLSKKQKGTLRQRFPPSLLVKRPVKVEALDGRDEGREYAWKWQRFRRQRYLATSEYRKAHKRTRSKALRPQQAVKLALVEHRLGLAARVISNKADDPTMQAFLASLKRVRDGP